MATECFTDSICEDGDSESIIDDEDLSSREASTTSEEESITFHKREFLRLL